MKLPTDLENIQEWTLVGPMGPALPADLVAHSILAVDGGARFCSHMDVWVGDGDSQLDFINCLNKYQFSPHKSLSDLALALSFFKQSFPLTLHAWGFLGGRRDHELLNFGESLHFLAHHPRAQINFYEANGRLAVKCLAAGEWNFHHQGIFSLASMKDVILKMTGACEYPIPEEISLTPLSSLGLSNVGHGDIHLLTQGPVMVIFPEAK
jgi:thiamine pyrophosphokinase